MLKSMRKSKNRYFYHIFVSLADAPGAITLNVVWMEREFDAYKLSHCMCLTITVSEIQRDICEKIVILSYPLAFDAPVRGGGSRRNIGTPFGTEKLEWCKNFEDIFIRFDVIHERDRQTDRRTPGDSKDRAYVYASRGKNC